MRAVARAGGVRRKELAALFKANLRRCSKGSTLKIANQKAARKKAKIAEDSLANNAIQGYITHGQGGTAADIVKMVRQGHPALFLPTPPLPSSPPAPPSPHS